MAEHTLKNEFIASPLTEEIKKEKEKEPRKKKKKSSGFFLFAFFEEERTQKIFGLLFMLIGLYLVLAFISHIFSGTADQSIASAADWKRILGIGVKEGDAKPENFLGMFGAVTGYYFITQWFGYPAFLAAVFIFLAGYDLFHTGADIIPLRKIFMFCFFFLIWISVAFAFVNDVFGIGWQDLGGGFGFVLSKEVLPHIVGKTGEALLLVILFLGFLVLFFNTTFPLHTIVSAVGKVFKSLGLWFSRMLSSTAKSIEQTDAPKESAFGGQNISPTGTASKVETVIEKPVESVKLSVENERVTDEPKEKSTEEKKTAIKKKTLSAAEEKESDAIDLNVSEGVEEKIISDDEIKPRKEVLDILTEKIKYQKPPLDLLDAPQSDEHDIDRTELEENKNKIISTLATYGIETESIQATVGPTVTLFELKPKAGVKISKITSLTDDIAMSLAAMGIRIIAPIPGKGAIGIEIPNRKRKIVPLRSLLSTEKFMRSEYQLPMALGKTISNEVFVADLTKMPHLLIAGATGQGKSVGLNAILLSLLYAKDPATVKFVLIDPKKVELSNFRALRNHFLVQMQGDEDENAIITDTHKSVKVLNSLLKEMELRYDLLAKAHVRSIAEYNEKYKERKLPAPFEKDKYLPYLLLIVDELADLMMIEGKQVELPVARLAQLARAVGIHLILATQRPSVDVITGIIKANFPSRIAYKVVSKVDSRTILDEMGADQLVGNGDMLLLQGSSIIRLQTPFVSTEEMDRVTNFITEQTGFSQPYLLPEVADESDEETEDGDFDSGETDEYFEEAARLVVSHQQGSVSLIQRRLKLGYNRAGRIIDQLEKAGIVGPFEGSKAREVLIADLYTLEQHLNNLHNGSEKNGE